MKKQMIIGIIAIVISGSLWAAQRRAKNVVLFVGDAAGLPILSAAAAYNGQAQSLFIQKMPYIGLMDTSAAKAWVTDSAAAMTAMVTGHKTLNGIISQSDSAERGTKDGETLKTILEYAEEHGLSTGVITNDVVTGATAAACYSHSNDRRKVGEIFAQLLKPRYGDGVDVLIGNAGKVMQEGTTAAGKDMEPALRSKGYLILKSVEELPLDARRAIVLLTAEEFDLGLAVRRTIEILSRNPKGYFLMAESDLHTDRLKRGLERTIAFDRVIEQTVRGSKGDTLVLFAADHSFDTRIRSGNKGEPLIPTNLEGKELPPAAKPMIRVDGGHTGEEVVVAAQGPGAERVRGFFPNTQLFRIMLAAYEWSPDPPVGKNAVTK